MDYNQHNVEYFETKMREKKKKGMVRRFFLFNKRLEYLELPIFTDETGKRKIEPFRNTQCLKPTCVYDLRDLSKRYQNSNYSNYLNFICYDCRKLLDMSNFYLDVDFLKMIEFIWIQYHTDNVICEKIAIFSDGTWEPILPEYIKKLHQKVGQDKPVVFDQSIIEAPLDVTVYNELPMIDEFDMEEYITLYRKTMDEYENQSVGRLDIFLRRYNIGVTWGEFDSIKNQTSFPLNAMGVFIRYLDQFFQVRKQRLGATSKLKIGMVVVKVLNFDKYFNKGQIQFIVDNLDAPKASHSEYDYVILIFKYDERWILHICNFQDKKLKQIDYLDQGISSASPDEIYLVGCYIIEQLFAPFKFPKVSFPEKLVQQIEEQQMQDIKRKIQYMTDCGHHIALYAYSYIMEELSMIQDQKEWPQEAVFNQKYHNVQIKQGDKDSFTNRVLWIFLKMSLDTGVNVKVWNYQKPPIDVKQDSLDQYIDQIREGKEQWKFYESEEKYTDSEEEKNQKAQKMKDSKQQNKNPAQRMKISKKLGTYVDQPNKQSKQMNQDQNPTRLLKYWNDQPQQQQVQQQKQPLNRKSNLDVGQRQNQLQNSEILLKSNNLSGQFNQIDQSKSRTNDSVIKEYANQLDQMLTPNKNNSKVQGKQQINDSSDRPFLVMPKAELQNQLRQFKQQIIKEYRQQAIVKGVFNQQMIQAINDDQSDLSLSNTQINKSDYEKMILNLDSRQLDKKIEKLQRELGVDNLDIDPQQFDELLDIREEMIREKLRTKRN